MKLSDFLFNGGQIFLVIAFCMSIYWLTKTSSSTDDVVLKSFFICFTLGFVLFFLATLMEAF